MNPNPCICLQLLSLVFALCSALGGYVPSYIQPSLFSTLPPYIHFRPINKNITIPPIIRQHVVWPAEWGVRKELHDKAIAAAGLKLVRRNSDEVANVIGWLRLRRPRFKLKKFKQGRLSTPTEAQKVHLFPNIHEVSYKDRMWLHLKNMQSRFPNARFSFMPHTFTLPAEMEEFRKEWHQTQNKLWIVKPKSSFGRGIRLLKHWRDVQRDETTVVQKYLHKPCLYDNLKLELKLTFILTSVLPLRIYTLPDDLKIQLGRSNYSYHKEFAFDARVYTFRDGSSGSNDCDRPEGFYDHNDGEQGENVKYIMTLLDSEFGMDKILYFMNEAIFLTLISTEKELREGFLKKAHSRYTYFQVMSADFLLDETGKPWLLEINSSPSRAMKNPWSAEFAQNYYSEILNVAGFHFPTSLDFLAQELLRKHLKRHGNGASQVVFNPSFYNFHPTHADLWKQSEYEKIVSMKKTRIYLRGCP